MRWLRWLPRFRQAYNALPFRAEREKWTRSSIQAFQLERLNDLWKQATAHTLYYHRLQQEHRLPERFTSLEDFTATVPVLPKDTVRAQPRDLLSSQAQRGHWTRTSGSTGSPMSTYWGEQALREVRRFQYRFYDSWGVDIFDRFAFLWGHLSYYEGGLAGRLGRLRRAVEDKLRNRLRLWTYDLTHPALRQHLASLAAFRPVALYGWSTAVYLLARECLAVDFHCDSLRLASLTSEVTYPHMVQTVEEAFHIPAVQEYGATETSVLALEGPDRTMRVREDGVLLETVPRADGRYDILVTLLNNPSFPLFRYAIADVTDAPLQVQETGFAVLRNVAGRNNDLLLSRTGRFLHPSRFETIMKLAHPAIRRFRLHQQSEGQLVAWLEMETPSVSWNQKDLQKKLEDLLEGYPVEVRVVDKMPATAAGKHRWILSDLLNKQSSPVNGFSRKNPSSRQMAVS